MDGGQGEKEGKREARRRKEERVDPPNEVRHSRRRRCAVELQPDFKTIHVCLVENINDIYMVTKCANVYYIYDQNDTRVVHRRP